MRQAITTAYENWDSKVPKLRKEAKTLREENGITIKMVDELESRTAGKNPLRWVFNKVARWQQLPELETKLAANNKRLQRIDQTIQYIADQCAGQICKAYVTDKTEIAAQRKALLETVEQMRKERSLFAEALERTDDVLGDIGRAWEESDEAQDMEHMDAWSGNNAGINFWSHMETEEAVSALQEAKVSLENYKEYLDLRFKRNTSVRVSESTITALADGNNWDFVIDMFGGFMGAWASWENAEKLGDAKQSLKTVEKQIEGIRDNLAIASEAATRKEDEALASLSSFRKDILRKLAEQGGLETKRFLNDVIDHMSADEVATRSDPRVRLEARFG